MSRGRSLAVPATLLAIVAAGAVLRFWALDHGLPLLRGRPDELEVIEATRSFPAWDFNPRFFVYPNFFFYLVYAWTRAVLALGGHVHDYDTLAVSGIPTLILVGRAFTATVGVASIPVAYVLARRIGGPIQGLVAAALLAGNFLHVRDSHALKPDVLLGIAMLVALWLLARHHDAPDRPSARRAGIAVGLAMGVKYNGVFLLVPAWVEGLRGATAAGWRRLLPSGSFVRVVATAAVVFLLACPYLLLDLGRTTFTSWFLAFTVFSTRPAARLPPGAGWLDVPLHFVATRAFGYHWAVSLWHGFGMLATLLAPIAVARALGRRQPTVLRMAAVFAIVYYLVIACAPVHLVRYLTALVPVLTFLLADLVATVARRAATPPGRAALAAALTAALVAQPVASGVAHDRIAARTDTRVLAAAWMREHVPPDAAVVVLGATLFLYAEPELPPGIRRLPNELPPADYARAGVTHVVTHEHEIPFSRPNPAQLEALGPRLRLLAEFRPASRDDAGGFEMEDAFYIPFYDFADVERPGPLVRIYAHVP